MCIQFENKLHGLRNYNPAFITGSTSTFSFKNYAVTKMHKHVIKSKSISVTDYLPTTLALSTIHHAITEARVCRKFEITYVLCKEGLAFRKMFLFVSWRRNTGYWVQKQGCMH